MLRNVFARREFDDDWTDDEDEDSSYAGGLGQLSSSQYHHAATASSNGAGSLSTSSPYATRHFATAGQGASSVATGMQQFSSRYAGVRGIFAQAAPPPPPLQASTANHRPYPSLSLGNEFAPRVISSTLHSGTAGLDGVSTSLAGLDQMFASTNGGSTNLNHAASSSPASPPTPLTSAPTPPQLQQQQQQTQGSRIMSTFTKPTQIIEEDEEDE